MNNSNSMIIKLMALMLLVVMALSMVGCDKLPFINNDTDGEATPEEKPEEKPQHTHNFVNGKCQCGESDPDYKPEHRHYFVGGVCECGATDSVQPEHKHEFVDGKCQCGESDPNYNGGTTEITTITIAQAIEIANANPNGTTERYYIRATVKTISNPAYGEMTIMDETGELYVYGTYSADGELSFPNIEATPVKGDEVLLHCILSTFDDAPQVKNARLIEFTHIELNPEDIASYKQMTIAEARDAEVGDLVRIQGVVAQITYANGMKPSGAIIVDGTSSIYVYDGDFAGQVNVGNYVDIAASKAYWILDTEQSNAATFGYKGSNQVENVILVSNDKGNNDFDKSWITETTVKDIMDTPASVDITNKIVKVNAYIKKAVGTGFTNYYIDDIDGVTGSYVYTQCNGNDFGWLDEFDGKICTVYFVAINAKSTASGCNWRFLPIEVIDEGYTFDVSKAPEYAVKYAALGQFLTKYTGDPITILTSTVSAEHLGFEGVTLSYHSDNVPVVSFSADINGNTVLHCEKNGTATVTITATYGEYTYSYSFEITVELPDQIESITVADAILAELDSIVTVKGIVGPSVVNKDGFYLFGEDGSVIAVLTTTAQFDGLEIGHEVILKGRRERYVKNDASAFAGQTCIVEAEILVNYYGNHSYTTEKFVSGKTVEELYALNANVDYSTTVFVTQAIVKVESSGYYTKLIVTSLDGKTTITLYCSGAGQYSWLTEVCGDEPVTLELAACNWNDKTYWAFCALAVYHEDGTKTVNPLNFDKY